MASVSACDPPVVMGLPDCFTEFATDIADIYPTKEITLVHSRDHLLPRFDKWMHDTGTVSWSFFLLARLLTGCIRQLWTVSTR